MEPLPHDGALAGSPYPPIADYAFLSDCEVSALVAPSGSVEWMCLPRMDGPSVFGAMLDRDAGGFKVAPMGQRVPAGRRYLPGTNVLETTWAHEDRLGHRRRPAADRPVAPRAGPLARRTAARPTDTTPTTSCCG